MLLKQDQNIRNCGGRYPESTWAKKGYDIGPIKIFECPKTFISKQAEEIIRAYDLIKIVGIPFSHDLSEVTNEFMEIAEIIETERSAIEADYRQVVKS